MSLSAWRNYKRYVISLKINRIKIKPDQTFSVPKFNFCINNIWLFFLMLHNKLFSDWVKLLKIILSFIFKIGSKEEARKEMATMAIINFDIPGDAKFPLNALYGKPQDRNEAGQFLFHLVHEKDFITYSSIKIFGLFWSIVKYLNPIFFCVAQNFYLLKFLSFSPNFL